MAMNLALIESGRPVFSLNVTFFRLKNDCVSPKLGTRNLPAPVFQGQAMPRHGHTGAGTALLNAVPHVTEGCRVHRK